MQDDDRPSRPGGRSARVVASIYAAVGQLVGSGTDRITFPAIAELAGVNPTTLYRRWADVNTLLEEATVAALTRDGETVPNTGSLERDLTQWAAAIVQDIARPERARFLRAMVAARVELVAHCAVTERRRDQAAEVLGRAAARGEPAPSIDQVLDHVIAPIYHRVVFALHIDTRDAQRLVHDVMAMSR